MPSWVYMLECADRSFYVGSARDNLECRVAQHQAGEGGTWTKARRPVRLVYAQEFDAVTDAIAAERQIKGWSRAKKKALICGDWSAVQALSKRVDSALTLRDGPSGPPQDEV